MKQIPDQLQRQIWATEQEILDVIHQVCTEYGLRYSLAYGTLIGAVRHKGFIPWDDDIDLIMPREDYEKLLAIWNEAAPKGYILQNTRTDPDFTQNFTKIRKDHTTFLQDESEREKHYHKGIFVDIFPASGSVRQDGAEDPVHCLRCEPAVQPRAYKWFRRIDWKSRKYLTQGAKEKIRHKTRTC